MKTATVPGIEGSVLDAFVTALQAAQPRIGVAMKELIRGIVLARMLIEPAIYPGLQPSRAAEEDAEACRGK